MSKKALKQKLFEAQNGVCELSGEVLPYDISLYDTDRIVPKADGGIYTDENTRVVIPVHHMERHGNLRELTGIHKEMRTCVDSRNQVMKLYYKVNNQMLAYRRRTDHLNPEDLEFLAAESKKYGARLAIRDKELFGIVKEYAKNDPLTRAVLGLVGVGFVTAAYCAVYIDLTKARHASCLWSYVGLHKASHERYVKGKKGGGNKNLRTALFTMAVSQEKNINRGATYAEVYNNTKTRLANSDNIVWTYTTEGTGKSKTSKLVQSSWKDTKPGHRRGAALRAVMKHFLADYWWVGRTLLGLETSPLYPEAMLGGNHRTIMPEERGWVY